jgi:PTH1 family peptidyl-tRNA hydrolase
MGIGPAPDGTALREFVLSPFARSELEAAEQMTTGAAQAALCWAREGLGAAMNRFNCRADEGSA